MNMNESEDYMKNEPQVADELPHLSQKLALQCEKCGQEGVYDVGRIFSDIVGSEPQTPEFQ